MGEEGGQVVAELAGDFTVLIRRAFLGDEARRGVDQFVEVIQPLLAFLLVLVMGAQAGEFNDVIDQFRQRQMRGIAQRDDQLRERGELGAAGAGDLRDRRMQAAVGGLRRILQEFEAARTDAARGEIHHAGKSGVVLGVGDQAQIGQRMLDLGALEKAQAAIHAIGQAGVEQRMFEGPRLRVAAIEQRDFGARMAVARQGLDLLDDPARFVAVGIRLVDADRLATARLGPQVLAQARGIVLDDGIRGVEDVAFGAVVLFEADQVSDLELALEIGHVAHIRAAEGVDRLVVVADAKQAGAAAGEQLQPAVLQLVGVLKLVNQNVAEALLIVPAQRFIALQQFVGTQQQLGEIDHAFALALRFVGLVEPNALPRPVVIRFDRSRAQALLLLRVDEVAQLARREFFVIDIQRFQQTLDGRLLIGGVEDLEQLRQAGVAIVGAQQAVAEAVKGADPHSPDIDRQHAGEPRLHLLGRLVGEGHRQNAGRRHLPR